MKNKEPKYWKGQKEKPKKKRSGKKLCALLMAAFTLVMIADIANLFLTPAQNQMGFGPGGGFSVPENVEFTLPEGMEMPDDGEMPGGNFQPPEGMEMPGGRDFSMPDSSAAGENSEAPSFAGRPGGSRGGFLQTVRRLWLPILIVCALGDLICLVILVRIRRKEKALEQAFGDESGRVPLLEDEEAEDDDAPPRKKGGFWVIIVCLAVAFAMILSMLPTGEDAAGTGTIRQELISGTAEAAEINTVLSGAGTLEADTLTPVTVPQQVTVLKYHVRNGETVASGDSLVSVDKTSAASAMRSLAQILEDLDDDLSSEKNKSQSTRITSATSGRVKKIYAQEGDKVADVLYAHGALMLLSLDGCMKVTFESDQVLSVGDPVEVRYSGGTEAGRIATVRMGKVTVTLSDKMAPYGAAAVIVDKDGNTIGEGKLEINSEMKIIGYYGTAAHIQVDVDDKVTAGSTLVTLEDVGYTTEYQILLARRNELEEQLQKLSRLSETGMICAENDGIISGVPDDAQIELLSNMEAGTGTANNLSAASGGWKVVLLTNVAEEWKPAENVYYAAKVISANDSLVNVVCAPTAEVSASFDPAKYDNGQMTQSYQLAVTLFQRTPQADSYLIFQAVTEQDGSSAIKVTVPPSTEEPAPETKLNGTYAAKLVANTDGTLYVWLNPTAGDYTAADLTTLEMQMTRFGGFSYSPAVSSSDIPLGSSVVKLKDLKADDLLLLSFTEDMVTQVLKAQRTAPQQPADPPGGQNDGPQGGGMPSGGTGGMPSGMGGSMAQTYDSYIVEETELLYVSDQEEVSVTISIDELDILCAAVGMEAQVTLDAVKGLSYGGKIARIANDGTNDGGNTKYEVTILLPRADAMLDGMNASIQIVTATNHADVAIPVAALVENDGKTYVYTTYDAQTDTLGGLAEVETGVSDGELTEILSGLDVGDTYYYRYADTVTYHFLSTV